MGVAQPLEQVPSRTSQSVAEEVGVASHLPSKEEEVWNQKKVDWRHPWGNYHSRVALHHQSLNDVVWVHHNVVWCHRSLSYVVWLHHVVMRRVW